MMRKLSVLLASLLLAACFTAGKRGGDAAMAVYDLGPLAAEQPAAVRPQAVAIEVRMPLWFDALGINYRLGYAEPARLREYARARWAGPPAQLIQQRLARDLALTPSGQGRASCLVRLDIDEFSQVFVTPTASRGVIQGRVQWLDRTRTRLAEQVVDIELPATSLDASGGVAALTAVVAKLTVRLHSWENELQASGRLKSCLH